MENEELAYLAGFIDGEGSIAVGINKNPRGDRRWYLRFSVHQLNPRPLEMLSARFGGSVRLHGYSKDKPGKRKIYEWVTTAEMAYNALLTLRPYLIVKADEADVAIAFQQALRSRKSRTGRLTVDEESVRDGFYQTLRKMKQRAYIQENSTQ